MLQNSSHRLCRSLRQIIAARRCEASHRFDEELVALSCTMCAISFSSFTKYRYMIYVTINIMYCIFYTLVSFKLRELSFAFTACFRASWASCASCKASVVSCTSFRKLVETKTWSEIQLICSILYRRLTNAVFQIQFSISN